MAAAAEGGLLVKGGPGVIRPNRSNNSFTRRSESALSSSPTSDQYLPKVETCNECGGDVRVIASSRPQGCGRKSHAGSNYREDPLVIRMILDHLHAKGIHADLLPQCRALSGIGFSTKL